MTLLDIAKDISFDEPTHVYKDKSGKILTSVTTVLSDYKKKFDESGIIARMCAKRKGITKQEMEAEWKETNRISCDYGHSLHSQVEHFIKTGQIKDTTEKDIVEEFAKIKFDGEIFSELRLCSPKYSMAGTADFVVLKDNVVSVSDLKSNKRFDIKSRYGNKFFYPLGHLEENHHTTYSLQILIYGEMIKEHGFDFKPGQIIWVNPQSRKIEIFEVLDLNKEVSMLLNHFNAIQNF